VAPRAKGPQQRMPALCHFSREAGPLITRLPYLSANRDAHWSPRAGVRAGSVRERSPGFSALLVIRRPRRFMEVRENV